MRWLVHGNLTPAVAEALVRHGHTAETVGPAQAKDFDALAKLVRSTQRDLMTNDKAFVQHLLDKPTKLDRSVVHLQLEGADVEQDDAVDRLFERYDRLKPGMLYTVTETRVKVRQLPNSFISRETE